MIIHCIDRREAEKVLLGLMARGRRYDEQFDRPEETSVLVCQCSPSCRSVRRARSSRLRGYTTDEIRDIIAAGDLPEATEGGDADDLSALSEEEAVPEHEDRYVSVFQGELWDTRESLDWESEQEHSEALRIAREEMGRPGKGLA